MLTKRRSLQLIGLAESLLEIYRPKKDGRGQSIDPDYIEDVIKLAKEDLKERALVSDTGILEISELADINRFLTEESKEKLKILHPSVRSGDLKAAYTQIVIEIKQTDSLEEKMFKGTKLLCEYINKMVEKGIVGGVLGDDKSAAIGAMKLARISPTQRYILFAWIMVNCDPDPKYLNELLGIKTFYKEGELGDVVEV